MINYLKNSSQSIIFTVTLSILTFPCSLYSSMEENFHENRQAKIKTKQYQLNKDIEKVLLATNKDLKGKILKLSHIAYIHVPNAEPKTVPITKITAQKISSYFGKSNSTGNHPVSKVDNVYFKLGIPHLPNPGEDIAPFYLSQLMFDYDLLTSSTLVVVKPSEIYYRDKPSPKNQVFSIIQASKAIEGETLENHESNYENDRDFYNSLNKHYLSALTVLSMIMGHGDAKCDNFIANKKTDDTKTNNLFRPIGIDNDFFLSYPFMKVPTSYEDRHLANGFRNFMTLLSPNMQAMVDYKVVDAFKQLDPDILMMEWLHQMAMANKGYKYFAKNDILSDDDLEQAQLPWSSRSPIIEYVLDNLIATKFYLERDHHITHEQLFAFLNPLQQRYNEYCRNNCGTSVKEMLFPVYRNSVKFNHDIQQSVLMTGESYSERVDFELNMCDQIASNRDKLPEDLIYSLLIKRPQIQDKLLRSKDIKLIDFVSNIFKTSKIRFLSGSKLSKTQNFITQYNDQKAYIYDPKSFVNQEDIHSLYEAINDKVEASTDGKTIVMGKDIEILNLGQQQDRVKLAELQPVLNSQHQLKELFLHYNNLGKVEVKEFTTSLSRMANLRVLNLSGTNLGYAIYGDILKSLTSHPTLEWLGLAANKLGYKDKSVYEFARNNKSIKTIDLRFNRFNEIGVEHMQSIVENKYRSEDLLTVPLLDNNTAIELVLVKFKTSIMDLIICKSLKTGDAEYMDHLVDQDVLPVDVANWKTIATNLNTKNLLDRLKNSKILKDELITQIL